MGLRVKTGQSVNRITLGFAEPGCAWITFGVIDEVGVRILVKITNGFPQVLVRISALHSLIVLPKLIEIDALDIDIVLARDFESVRNRELLCPFEAAVALARCRCFAIEHPDLRARVTFISKYSRQHPQRSDLVWVVFVSLSQGIEHGIWQVTHKEAVLAGLAIAQIHPISFR